MQRTNPISEDERSKDVERCLLGHPQQCGEDDLLRLLLDDLDDGGSLGFLLIQELLEHRRLKDAKANPQADTHENDREREWNTPAPNGELIARPCAEGQDRKVRQKQAARDAELRPRRHQAALPAMS